MTQSNSALLWVTPFLLCTFLTARKGILDNLAERVVIPPNTVLVLCKLDKIVYCLAFDWEWDSNDGIFVVILRRVGAKQVRQFLHKC